MGLRFRKSKKIGGVRVNFSKSGIGYSVGTKGFRVTKKANGGTRTTVSAPGTGISYVKETGPNQQQSRSGNGGSAPNSVTVDSEPIKQKRHTLLWVLGWIFIFPVPLTILLNRKKNLKPILRYGIIIVAWIIYLMIAFSGTSGNSAQKDTETRSINMTPAEQSDDINEQGIIEAESINILDAGESNMVLGEERQLSAEVLPDNADDKKVIWESSDVSVMTIDESGKIFAVGSGTATIKGTVSNGVTSTCEYNVNGSRRIMKLSVSHPRQDDNNIGDEWSFTNEINGEAISRELIVEEGETLDFYARYSEEDDNPDIGEASTSYTISEEDFQNGFEVTMELLAKENGGRNSGKSADFLITYSFLPVESK